MGIAVRRRVHAEPAAEGSDPGTWQVGPSAVDDTCAGIGVVGILTGTETRPGRTVETETGFHFAGSLTLEYRVDFADGSYLVASQREPLTFNAPDRNTTFGGTLLEKGTLYDADGAVMGQEMFHAHFRWTIVDGTAVVEIDEGRLTCHQSRTRSAQAGQAASADPLHNASGARPAPAG